MVAATNFQECTSLFSGQVYQRSRPEIVSLWLMKDNGLSENSEVWKIFCVEIKSYKFEIIFIPTQMNFHENFYR